MLRIVDPEDAYELHINLIRHGREVCRPRPRCEECGLRRMCPYWRRLKVITPASNWPALQVVRPRDRCTRWRVCVPSLA